ncbi:MAG: hypothetical protein WC661_10300 [Opitutaceae bacterium]|jgi:hypothetical protein
MLSGKAVAAPARARNYCPKDFSAALESCGVFRSAKWVREQCRTGGLKTNPNFSDYFIPESELFRLLGIKEAQS